MVSLEYFGDITTHHKDLDARGTKSVIAIF